MLPNIRAVIAAMAAAITLLIVAFGVVATLRVAQESRAGSLHADLARRGQAVAAEPQPVMLIETPGPTLLAKAPEVGALARAADEVAPASTEPPALEREQAPTPVAASPEAPIAAVPAEPHAHNAHVAALLPAATESSAVAEAEPVPEPITAPAIAAAAPQTREALPELPSPAPILALGGPSPDEIAQAKEQRKAAERARARKAAAEKQRKIRAARIARERKLAAQRAAEAQARQQASAANPQGGFGFAPSGAFNNAPFGNSVGFGGATNRR